jgi:hypothetical protein
MQGIVRAATGTLPQTLVLALSSVSRCRGAVEEGLMPTKLACDALATAWMSGVICVLSSIPLLAAPTAELAKKCANFTAKAYPARVVGNPAAGSAKGSGRAEQDYYNDCIKKGGNIEPSSSSEPTLTQPIPIPVPRP